MYRSTLKPALVAALFVPCLLLTACGMEAGPEVLRPPVSPETALVESRAPIHNGYVWNAASGKVVPVRYAKVGGLAVVEGDIVIGSVAEVEARTREVEAQGGPEAGIVHAQGAVITDNQYWWRWPNGVVPYTIAQDVAQPSRLAAAINAWQQVTPIRFVLRTASNAAQYPNYVTFRATDTPGGNFSNVGRQPTPQSVQLSSGATTGIMIHEIGHVLGMWHEHTRTDRNAYVRILWENIIPAYSGDFDIRPPFTRDVVAYDYNSIMHYGPYIASKNGLPTIEALGGQAIGQDTAPSAGDVATIRSIYSSDDSEFFVQQLYTDVLNREPDTSGFVYYLGSMNGCSGNQACLDSARVSAARSLFESAEHRQQHPELDPSSPNYKAAYINNCYTSFLRRPHGPGDGTYWLDFLNSTSDYNAVIRGFITAAEYRSRFM
ncbi:M12 family metallopeptidase [Pyxidicoccus sp. MSG2]|uniref:M12 family metallopeptidase n=1 Tax=Pyxidicoccus sp. MSG2 TaxID=2996790 RepID=UPI00226DBCDB|nr:M12 family metallopeptidase [Pyxidicoccus sp. MSG2]MCY1015050.1 M12 family metallopeptidase [Pyxidicoccus sp. MSG2]